MKDLKSIIAEIKEKTENEECYFYDEENEIEYIKDEDDNGCMELRRIRRDVYEYDEDKFIVDINGKVVYVNVCNGEIKEIKEF